VAVARVREPGRHLSRNDRRFDRLRPWPRFFIAQQRHRPDLTWAMAALAILLQDRKDVLVEGDNPTGLLTGPGRRRPLDGAQQQNKGRQSQNGNSDKHGRIFCLPQRSHKYFG